MIIFLYGPDDYRRLEKKEFVLADYAKKHLALGADTFDCEDEEGWERLRAFTGSQSLFEPTKLAALYNLFSIEAKKRAEFVRSFLTTPKTVLLISENEKPPKAFEFLLKKPATSQKFENLSGDEWRKFIATEAKKKDIVLAPRAATLLGEVYKNNAWGLVTALGKAALLRKRTIDLYDLEALDIEAAPSFWEILNGLKSSSSAARLGALEKALAEGEPAAKIWNIISAQRKEKTPLFAEGDIAVKTGKLEYEEALLRLTLSD